MVSTTEESDPNEVVTIMVKLDGDTTFMQTNSLEAAVASSDTMVTALTQAANRVATTLNEKIVVDNTYSLPSGYTWKSSKDAVATVDEDGYVTAGEKTGTVTITATANDGSGKKATVKIKVG